MSDEDREGKKASKGVIKRIVDWLYGSKSWKGPDPGYRTPQGGLWGRDPRTPDEQGFGKNP